jgi:hypothetical protein
MGKTLGILIGNDFDLSIAVRNDSDGKIVSGLKIGDSVYQQQTLLLVTGKGEWKDKPLTGVGINTFLLDDANNDELYQEVRAQFVGDGMTVRSIEFTNGQLTSEAEYENSDSFR